MTQATPDIFRNVHKGIRKALFDAICALGRAGEQPSCRASARAALTAALRFIAHHGENEDLLLIPRLQATAPQVAEQLRRDHALLDRELSELRTDIASASTDELYARAAQFTARYLEHMHAEESLHEPVMRATLRPEQLSEFGREALARTAPDDQRMMLAFMLPAMAVEDALGLLSHLPPALADELRQLVA